MASPNDTLSILRHPLLYGAANLGKRLVNRFTNKKQPTDGQSAALSGMQQPQFNPSAGSVFNVPQPTSTYRTSTLRSGNLSAPATAQQPSGVVYPPKPSSSAPAPTQTAQTRALGSLSSNSASSSSNNTVSIAGGTGEAQETPEQRFMRESAERAKQFGVSQTANAPDNSKTAAADEVISPTSPVDYSKLRSQQYALSSLLAQTPEEQELQQELAGVRGGYRESVASIEGQGRGIPISILRGQQAKLAEQGQLREQTLMERLGALQAKRQSQMEAAKAQLGIEESDVERAEKRAAQQQAQQYELAKEKRGRQFELEKEQRATAESARRFGIEQDLAQQKLIEDRRQADLNYNLSQQKFEEDKRQFGLNYALDRQRVAISAAKKSADTVGDEKRSAMLDNLSLVNDILKNPAAISGFAQSGLLPFTQGKAVAKKYDQLKGILALEKRQLLKGSGAISDFESRTLDRAASALSRFTSETAFEAELKRIRGVFMTAADLEAPVRVVSPGGEVVHATANRSEIDNLISEGNMVEYE